MPRKGWDGYEASFWSDKNVLNLTVVMSARLYNYTKNH